MDTSRIKARADFMTDGQKAKFAAAAEKRGISSIPRTHANCMDIVGVARPGKTARDRALRG